MKIIYLGHSSFLINTNNIDIIVDPYCDDSVPNLKMPRNLIADKVFCSHNHHDHNAVSLIQIKSNPAEVSSTDVIVPHDHHNGLKRGLNVMRMFKEGNYSIVHLGDIGCVPNKKLLEPFINCDVLLAPINGFFTINPEELKAICDIIKPRIVIPMHYYMNEKNSGYKDGEMIDNFKELFPQIEYLDNELDLDKYSTYKGALIFKSYLQ